MNSEKFSFIIQGPYDSTHLSMLDELNSYGKTILSTYKNDFYKIEKNINKYNRIILEDDLQIKDVYNHQNIYLQINGILNGLSNLDTDYVVKFRTNHCYSNIKRLIEFIIEHSDKYITSNISCNPNFPYHPCDSIIGGTYDTMNATFKNAMQIIKNRDFIYEGIDTRLCAEVLLFVSYLKFKKIKINSIYEYFYIDYLRNNEKFVLNIDQNYNGLIKNELQLFDVCELEPFVVNFRENFEKRYNIKCTEHLLEKRDF